LSILRKNESDIHLKLMRLAYRPLYYSAKCILQLSIRFYSHSPSPSIHFYRHSVPLATTRTIRNNRFTSLAPLKRIVVPCLEFLEATATNYCGFWISPKTDCPCLERQGIAHILFFDCQLGCHHESPWKISA
jgi:hypothetical protein